MEHLNAHLRKYLCRQAHVVQDGGIKGRNAPVMVDVSAEGICFVALNSIPSI